MKKTCLLILLITFILEGCTYKKKIKIGLLASFSGKYSEMAQNARFGTMLAASKYKEKGLDIEIKTYNSKGNPETIKGLVAKMERDDVHFVIGPMTSNMVTPLLTNTKDKNIIFISPTVSGNKFSNIDDNFFKISSLGSDQGIAIAKEIKKDELKFITVIYDGKNADYTLSVYQGIRGSILDDQIILEVDLQLIESSSYINLAKNIQNSKSEAVVFLGSGIDGGKFI